LPAAVTDLEISYLDLELKNRLIDESWSDQPSFIFPDSTNLLTSIAKDPSHLNNPAYLSSEIFWNYFDNFCHTPHFKSPDQLLLYEKAFECLHSRINGHTVQTCTSPCATISLAGNRVIHTPPYPTTDLPNFPSTTEPWPGTKPTLSTNPLILQNLYFGDVTSLFFFREMGLFTMIIKLIEHFDITGKYLFPNDGLSGILFQKCSELIRKSEYPFVSSLQLEGLFVRVLGWQSTGIVRKIDSNLITRNVEFSDLLKILMTQIYHLYAQSQIIDTMTQARAVPPAESEIAIQNTLLKLKSTIQYFNSNNNWYLTLNAFIWLICGLSLLEKSLDTIGIPTTLRGHPMYYIPYAYDILVGKDSSVVPKIQNRYLSYLPLVTTLRHILIQLEKLDLSDNRRVRIFIANNIPRFLAFNDAYKAIYGINLAAPEYRTVGILRLTHEAI
jgi:hypothetical protein